MLEMQTSAPARTWPTVTFAQVALQKTAMMVGTRDRQSRPLLAAGRPALGLWLEFGPDLSSSCSVQQGEQSSANRLANFTDTPARKRRARRRAGKVTAA